MAETPGHVMQAEVALMSDGAFPSADIAALPNSEAA